MGRGRGPIKTKPVEQSSHWSDGDSDAEEDEHEQTAAVTASFSAPGRSCQVVLGALLIMLMMVVVVAALLSSSSVVRPQRHIRRRASPPSPAVEIPPAVEAQPATEPTVPVPVPALTLTHSCPCRRRRRRRHFPPRPRRLRRRLRSRRLICGSAMAVPAQTWPTWVSWFTPLTRWRTHLSRGSHALLTRTPADSGGTECRHRSFQSAMASRCTRKRLLACS